MSRRYLAIQLLIRLVLALTSAYDKRLGVCLVYLPAGYEYGLKWDDDSYINAPVKYNMITLLRSKRTEFAYRTMIWDGWGYLAGLAELTR